ncbi:MAG: hypothetical protein R2724_07040 [Bryobacterales bacterium]
MPARRREFLKTAAAFAAAQALPAQAGKPWRWRSYAADPHSSHYAPLDQITADNVAGLEVAWELETLPANTRAIGMIECTPIVIDGVMYVSGYGLHRMRSKRTRARRFGRTRGSTRGAAGHRPRASREEWCTGRTDVRTGSSRRCANTSSPSIAQRAS